MNKPCLHTCKNNSTRMNESLPCCGVLQCDAACYSVLQCVAVCCSVLQCVAVCCSVMQHVAVCCSLNSDSTRMNE